MCPFPLPEAQLDRFMLRATIGYPDLEDEKTIITNLRRGHPIDRIEAVASPEEVVEVQHEESDGA